MSEATLILAGVAKAYNAGRPNAVQVLQDVSLHVAPGEVVALVAPSGAGKSTLMRMVCGNYLASSGFIRVGDLDVAQAAPRQIIALRRETLGYVSQFLRVIPRVAAIDVVAEPLLERGPDGHPLMDPDAARAVVEGVEQPRLLFVSCRYDATVEIGKEGCRAYS
mgnify:CR=1 FL=1